MPKRKQNNILPTRAQVVLLGIVLLYAIVSAIGLGDGHVPVTQPQMTGDETRTCIGYAAFDGPKDLDSLLLYKGLGVLGVTVYIPDETETQWIELTRQVCDTVYAWIEIPLDCTAKTVCISVGAAEHGELFEVGFLSDGAVVPVDGKGSEMFDEQSLVPTMPTSRNGTYFDEIYHVRTAYEHLLGIEPYEISHPPLGKLLISVGIAMSGMHPLGWRIMGWLFGVLMIPVLYLLAKRLFGREVPALASAAFFALDFMHFTQSRIALIDSASVLFILISYLLMYRYYDSTPETLPYKSSLWLLAACGAVMGLGIAVKWTVVYAALGLAVFFAIAAVRRYRAGENVGKTCLWCVLFFGVVPFFLYFLSYIPYFIADPTTSPIRIFVDNQVYMLTYHSGLENAHPFRSAWYTWPLMLRPMWYYGVRSLAAEGLCSSIVAMGNPAVWWCGTLCMLCLLFCPKKTRAEIFILIGFAAQYLPWGLISRPAYIYHFYASVPFLILAMVAVFGRLSSRWKTCRAVMPTLLVAATVLFVLFYPILSGTVTDRGYVMDVLSWLPGWTLCY